MNINRNVLKIAAGVLLVAALPAGAQVLGGSLGGAANGALGGGLGQGIHGNGGLMGGGSITGPDLRGTTGKLRERAQQAGARTKDAATNATDAVRARVEQTHGAVNGAAHATAAGAAAQQDHGALLSGAGSANAQKSVLGRDVSASGAAAAQGALDRDGLRHGTSSAAAASVQKRGAESR